MYGYLLRNRVIFIGSRINDEVTIYSFACLPTFASCIGKSWPLFWLFKYKCSGTLAACYTNCRELVGLGNTG